LIEWALVALVLVPVLSILSATTTTTVGLAGRSLVATVLGSADSPVYRERASGSAALVIEGARDDVGVVTFFLRLDYSVSATETFKSGARVCYNK